MSNQEVQDGLRTDHDRLTSSMDGTSNSYASSLHHDKVESWRDSWSLNIPAFTTAEESVRNHQKRIRRLLSIALISVAIILLAIAWSMMNTEEVSTQKPLIIADHQQSETVPVTNNNKNYMLMKQSEQQVFDAVMFCFENCVLVAEQNPVL